MSDGIGNRKLVDKIFRVLKERNYRTADEISDLVDEPFIVVLLTLDMLGEIYGYIGCKDGRYYIKQVLDPIPPSETVGYVKYRDVLERLPAASGEIPGSYMNRDVGKVVHRDQGSSSSCVGQSTAYGRDLDLIRITGQAPDESDTERVKRNVPYNENLWYDIYYRQSFSAEYAYRKSREVGNVTYPTGSYLPASLKSLKLNGICLHDQWYNPKSGIMAWDNPFPDYAETVGEHADETAPKHKIAGYASVDEWDDVKRAIFNHGYVLGSILVWENYCRSPGDVNLPTPKGNVCGAHALCFVGYDDDNLYFLHSWWGDNTKPEPEWNKVGAIDHHYFNCGFLGGYVVMDDEETEIAFEMYTTVEIRSETVPDAELYINDEYKGTLPVTLVLKSGVVYEVVLKDPRSGIRYSNVIEITGTCKEVILNPVVTWRDRIVGAIKRILRLIKKR